MTASEQFAVRLVEASALHDLRRRVLRDARADAVVSDPRDDEPLALHFGGFLGERLVVAGSFYPSTSPVDESLTTYQLRYLATDFDVQGCGYGAQLMSAAESRLTSRGVQQVWANGRDSALGFYRATGWSEVAGSEHLSPETQLPHTLIFKTLHREDPLHLDWASPADARSLARLREEMHFAVTLRRFRNGWVDSAARYFAETLSDGSVIAAVARTKDSVPVAVAAASLRRVAPGPRYPAGAVAYVHTVSTLPAFRRRGLSRQLLEMLVDELRSRGVERLDLHASDQGRPLYEELGFGPQDQGVELRLIFAERAVTDVVGDDQ
jgi:GNAT superfamily N-acetyltransferase